MQPSILSRSRTLTLPRLAVGGVLFLALVILSLQLGGGGEDAAPPAATAAEAEPSIAEAPSPGEMLAILVGVIVLLAFTLWVLPKLLRRGRLAPRKERALELVDALPLGPKRQVFVVNFRDRTLILGAGSEDLSLLAEYGGDEFATTMEEVVRDELEQATAATPETTRPQRAPKPAAKPAATEAAQAERASKEAAAAAREAPAPTRPKKAPRPAPSSEDRGVALQLSDRALELLSEGPDPIDRPVRPSPRRPMPAKSPRRGTLPEAFKPLASKSLSRGEDAP